MIVDLQHPVLHLVEDTHAPGEAYRIHVVQPEVQQALGSGDFQITREKQGLAIQGQFYIIMPDNYMPGKVQ